MSRIYPECKTVPTIKVLTTAGRTVRTALTLAITATTALASGYANADFDIEGNTLLFTDSDWYQVQTPNTFVTICNGASSCTVASGDYIVINHTTGERWESVSVPIAAADADPETDPVAESEPAGEDSDDAPEPGATTLGDLTIAGSLLTFATSDWFQVQQSADFQTVCEGVASCLLEGGSYIVVNHSTGTRYEDVLIGSAVEGDSGADTDAETSTVTGTEAGVELESDAAADSGDDAVGGGDIAEVSTLGFDGVSIRWPDDGWYQIQNSADFSTICEGGASCPVVSGSYIVINLTTGQRWENFTVQLGVPGTIGDDSVAEAPITSDTGDAGPGEDATGDGPGDAVDEVVADDGTTTEAGGGAEGEIDSGDESVADVEADTDAEEADAADMVATAAPEVEGSTIVMAGPGWYQVQSADDFSTLCDGPNRCDVPRGNYIVVNHTTGERWEDIAVFNTAGVWFGTTSFGEGVFIINAENNLYGLSTRDDGIVETVFGDADGTVQRYLHVASRNLDHGTSFNLLGERPENFNVFDMNDVDYDLVVTNDGQSLVNSGIGGNFSLTFATVDDVKPISVLSVAGQWESRTAFCDIGCDLTMVLEISNSGFVSGSSRFNTDLPGQLAGSAAAADSSNLYLQIEFLLNGDRRAGVVYYDRLSDSLILNTVGVDAGTGSLAAVFQRN